MNGVAGTPVSPSYDAMGNVISHGGSTFGYDVAGRMVQATSGASSADYQVNSEGLRVRKTVTGPGAIDAFAVYDDQRRRIGTYRPDGLGGFTVDEELVYLPDTWRLIATVRGQVVGGDNGIAYPVLTDQIGSARVVLDPANGDIRWTWAAREAFGAQAPNENPSAVGSFTFDARFPGQFLDVETGLFHNGYRDYSAQWGRYVQSDPIGLAAGWNTYEYVGGNPAGAYDPLGLSERDVERFRNQFYKTVNRMTREGLRHPDPKVNNRYGQWDATLMRIIPFLDGNPLARREGIKSGGYEVCSGQTRILGSDLFYLHAGGTDDIWTIKNPHNGSHYWVEAVSSNPSDPLIKMDPWMGTFEAIRHQE